MCTTNIYGHIRPDGRRSTSSDVLLCPASRFGRPCAANIEVHHQASGMMMPPPGVPVTSFPPTPTYSPRPSSHGSVPSEGSHRSSRHSSTSSSRRQRSPGIYVNGQRVINAHGSARGERILLVPNPPTPRTPPQSYSMPRTAPPSPSTNLSIPYSSSPRESYNRPYIVDERPRLYGHLNPAASPAASSRHSRQASNSSQGSRRSNSSAAAAVAADDDQDSRRRKQEREARREARKQQELRERIDKANAEIANRPAVRVARSSTEQLGERQSRRDGFDKVVGAMGRMTVEDKNWKETRAHEKALKLEREEQEAQRLRESAMPRRRATVGPGSRRHRVAYDDGLYRWE